MQRLRQLGPLTDQRPSDLLRQMERILGRSIEGDEIGQEEFIRRLPVQPKLVVRSQADLFTVEQLAQMADRLASVPVMPEVSPNFAITHADAPREGEVISLASIHQQLSKLTASNDIISAEVADELKRSTSYSGNHSSRGVSRADTASGRCTMMYRGLSAEGLCWYNFVWGRVPINALMVAARRETPVQVVRSDNRPASIYCSPLPILCRSRVT